MSFELEPFKPALGLCSGSLASTSVAELIGIAGDNGFSSIMILPDSNPPPRGEVRRLLDENRITRVVLDGVLGMLPRCRFAQEHGITAEHHFRAAEIYHVTHFNVPHYQGDPDTPISAFVAALKPFCERTAQQGIVVSLEFLPGTGIPDIPRAMDIITATAAPNLGITIDTWHMARTGATPAEIRALPKGIIRDFHISDRAADQDIESDSFGRRLPGEGDQALGEIIDAVLENAPGMAISAEIFSHDLQNQPPREAARKIAQALQRVVRRSGTAKL